MKMTTYDVSRLGEAGDPRNETSAAMDRQRLLRIYMRDHEAAAVGGLHLACRCWKANRGTPYEAHLQRLASNIRAERDELRNICRQFGVRFSGFRRAVVFAGATLGRFKLNGRLLRYSPLSRVIELEALSAGVISKRRLWESLGRINVVDQPLGDQDLTRLAMAADEQLTVLRHLHDLAVDDAFEHVVAEIG